MKRFIFMLVAILLTCFQTEKSQNKLDLMQSFLLTPFTKRVKINFKRSKANQSHMSYFPFSFCMNQLG